MVSRPNGIERLNVYCRPARQEDTRDVIELTSTIWEGDDYVPYVWEAWLADPQGLLAVAEHRGRVLGLGKLTRLSEEDWWLEGLRTQPEYEGRGIASQITDYLVNYWLKTGGGTIRLATASFRYPVHHLCERLGFEKVFEYTPFVAVALEGVNAHEIFQPVTLPDISQAVDIILHSSSLALTHGLIELDWQWSSPRREYLAEAVRKEKAWWWRGREGLITTRLDEEEARGTTVLMQFAACSMENLGEYLHDFLRLVAWLGYERAGWMAPLRPGLLPTLEAAGFQRDWEHAIFVYEKKYPGHSIL